MEDFQNGRVGLERSQDVGVFENQSANVNDAVAEEELPPHPETCGSHGDLNTQGRYDQRLMIRKTYPVEKHRQKKVAVLFRRIDPSQKAEQHDHERGDAERVD